MPQITCQFCGRENEISVHKPASAYGVPWKPYRPMADSARRIGDTVETAPEFTEAYRDTPARAPSIPSDVGVALTKALVTGALCGTLAGIGAVAGLHWPWWWIPAAPFVTAAGVWLVFLFKGDPTLWVREKIVNKDLNDDGQIGAIRVEASLRREDVEEDHWDLANLPAPSWAYLQAFARDILDDHVTFSEEGADDYGYTQAMFRDLRDRFVAAGWARWRNPEHRKQGVILLVGGKTILRQIISEDV